MPADDPAAIVQAWQDAVNRQDLARLLELSDPHIEVMGPRGSGFGRQLLQDWLAHAGVRLQTRRLFVRGDIVVVAQQARWQAGEAGDVPGERPVASRCRVAHGQVVQYARYEDLDTALAASGLTAADERVLPGRPGPPPDPPGMPGGT